MQVWRDRHREGAAEERQTLFVCCQGERVQVWRDRHREGAGEERQTQRGCRRGETDICVLSGREGASLERQTLKRCRLPAAETLGPGADMGG